MPGMIRLVLVLPPPHNRAKVSVFSVERFKFLRCAAGRFRADTSSLVAKSPGPKPDYVAVAALALLAALHAPLAAAGRGVRSAPISGTPRLTASALPPLQASALGGLSLDLPWQDAALPAALAPAL